MKNIIFMFFIVLCSLSCSAYNSNKKIIGIGDYIIGVIENEKIQFYEMIFFNNDKKVEFEILNGKDLILPYEYTDVIDTELGIGIIYKNLIKFYNGNDEPFFSEIFQWELISDIDMILPNEYTGVISIDRYIGVIVKNNIQFYEYIYENKIWQIIPDVDMALPNRYKNVFGCSIGIGLIINNKIEFFDYNFENKNWIKIPGADMILPNNFRNVFGLGSKYLGVFVDNVIKIFEYRNDIWDNIYNVELI